MTNYEKIMAEMTIEQMAEILTTGTEHTDLWETLPILMFENDAGSFYDYEDAIAAEIEWLRGEAK